MVRYAGKISFDRTHPRRRISGRRGYSYVWYGCVIRQLVRMRLRIWSHIFAAIGFVCVFAAAINTPITAIVLGIEVFGASAAPYFVLAVLISFIASGNTTIYPSQKFPVDKSLFHFQKKWRNRLEQSVSRRFEMLTDRMDLRFYSRHPVGRVVLIYFYFFVFH